jgi:hypothetical protein
MEVLMGKSSINGPFSMAMLNKQRVITELVLPVHPTSMGLHHDPNHVHGETT